MSDKFKENRRPPSSSEITCRQCRKLIRVGQLIKGETPVVVYDFGQDHQTIVLCGSHYTRQKEDYEPSLADLLTELKDKVTKGKIQHG